MGENHQTLKNSIANRILQIGSRVLVWGGLLYIVYILRTFSLLIFLTFIFSYIQNSFIKRVQTKIKSRNIAAVISFCLFIFIVSAIGVLLVPKIKDQAKLFIDRYPLYVSSLDSYLLTTIDKYPSLKDLVPQLNVPGESITTKIFQHLLEGEAGSVGFAFSRVTTLWVYVTSTASAFFLSILFSFLIILDFDNLKKGVTNLKKSRIAFIYDEVSEGIFNFASVMGRAMEAQLVIAIINAFLTAFGLVALGFTEKIIFLSTIVFICSFIPVAGVFISSVPICLVALQESGLNLMLLSILMITVIHIIEAYIINPRIYGHHMKMNPVIVLIILTVGGKLFGVWGLVLGVPVCNYLFRHAIRSK